MKFEKNELILILGGSRGLGKALLEQLQSQNMASLSLSRKSENVVDFSKIETWSDIFQKLQNYEPTRLIYCAGGGPYGEFSKYQWKDHQWTFRVNFEFPAFLAHSLSQKTWPQLKQICFVGSSVAEMKPDPFAASYSASKHALRGLVTTLQKEGFPIDLRLLSPGYMETNLLPLNSEPRLRGLARSPKEIASLMIQSISNADHRHSHQSFY